MDVNTYSDLALRTAKQFPADDGQMDTTHAYLGVIGEVGEIADALKRHIIYGKPLDLINLVEELGDLIWYMNLMIRADDASTEFTEREKLKQALSEILYPQGFERSLEIMQESDQVHAMRSTLGVLVRGVELLGPAQWTSDRALGGLTHLGVGIWALVQLYGLSIPEILRKNIEKLSSRYGDKYSDHAALHRDTQAERRTLES